MTEQRLQAYIRFLETLDRESVGRLGEAMTEEVHFADPFNDVRGLVDTQKIFAHMFDELADLRFEVTAAAVDADSGRGLMRWELHAKVRGRPYKVLGMSELGFAPDGRVAEHIDHWDSGTQFYMRLPVIGWLLGLIRARLAV